VTSLSYVILAIYLPIILNHVVSFLLKRVLHSQILILPVLGVGCAMVTVSLIVCIYYNVIMSYTVYYMVSSLASEVPWSKCDPSWADMSTCYVRGSPAVSNTQLMLDLTRVLQMITTSRGICMSYVVSQYYV
jgi:SNF family Na+-dependent transporter